MDNHFSRGFTTQVRIIGALILRDVHTRFGRENVGYLWMIGEPLLLATVITLIHVNQPLHFASDIQPAPFAIIGYTLFIVFRGVFNKAEGLIEQNGSLFYHSFISILDILVSRSIVEITGCISVTILLLTIAVVTGYAEPPARPLMLLSAIGLMCWWSFGFAMIAAAVSYRNHLVGRNLHVFSYLLIPISGAFFLMSALPTSFTDALRWFPMPLIFEQARYGQFRTASSAFVAPGYVVAWCAALTYVGLVLIRRLRLRLNAA